MPRRVVLIEIISRGSARRLQTQKGHGSAGFHPVATSFGAALHTQVVATLRARGHEIDECDLYVESFDPIMSEL
jgi:hypothetical protein